jgi:hypothetical protein
MIIDLSDKVLQTQLTRLRLESHSSALWHKPARRDFDPLDLVVVHLLAEALPCGATVPMHMGTRKIWATLDNFTYCTGDLKKLLSVRIIRNKRVFTFFKLETRSWERKITFIHRPSLDGTI